MSYNPEIHHRRSIRLKGYDYSQAGMYYITICCKDKLWRFGKIENGEMILNDFGQIAQEEWEKLPERYPNVILDVFQIMPNHIHFVLVVTDDDTVANDMPYVGAPLAGAPDDANPTRAGASPAPTMVRQNNDVTIGNIVGAYKSLVLNRCLELCKQQNEWLGKFWQRNYYESIIRSQKSYQNIYEYIVANPMNWQTDELF